MIPKPLFCMFDKNFVYDIEEGEGGFIMCRRKIHPLPVGVETGINSASTSFVKLL